MIKKTLEIDGKQVDFGASAAIPRLYRIMFRRDIMQDIGKLKVAFVDNQVEGKEFDNIDLELFENVAFCMAKHADKTLPGTIEDWLDNFNVFSIYQIAPAILELWHLNEETQVESKKNLIQVVDQ